MKWGQSPLVQKLHPGTRPPTKYSKIQILTGTQAPKIANGKRKLQSDGTQAHEQASSS
jgi:hypothetical protein